LLRRGACERSADPLLVAELATNPDTGGDPSCRGSREARRRSTRVAAGNTALGGFELTTTNEVLDDSVCNGEPVSGTTTVRGGGDTATFTYDGATECDSEHSVPWAFDGTPRGSVTGVQCAVAAPGAAPPGGARALAIGALPLIALAFVCGRARRRQVR